MRVLESTTNSYYVESNSRLEAILTLICPDLAYCNLDGIQECESVRYVVYCSKIIGLGQNVSFAETESRSRTHGSTILTRSALVLAVIEYTVIL